MRGCGIVNLFTESREVLPWVPEDILFPINTDGSRRLRLGSPSREPYQTVSTVYFILGILRTGLWSQGRKVYEVVLDRAIDFVLRYSEARPLRDLKTIKAFWLSHWTLRFFQFKFWNSCDASAS